MTAIILQSPIEFHTPTAFSAAFSSASWATIANSLDYREYSG
jgi:hypothetical protein